MTNTVVFDNRPPGFSDPVFFVTRRLLTPHDPVNEGSPSSSMQGGELVDQETAKSSTESPCPISDSIVIASTFDSLPYSKCYTDAKHEFVLNASRTLSDCYDPY